MENDDKSSEKALSDAEEVNRLFEEFAVVDVVDSKSDEQLRDEAKKEDSSNVIKAAKNVEPNSKLLKTEDLLNYDEEARQKKYFQFEWGVDEQTEDEEITLKNDFRDFLNLPKISGHSEGFSESNKIPAGKVAKSDLTIKLKDIPEIEELEGKDHNKDDNSHFGYSTVILNKNHDNEIVGLDLLCKCGNKIRIDFAFEDKQDEQVVSKNVSVIDPSADPSKLSELISQPLMEAAEDFENDEEYSSSLITQFDDVEEIPSNFEDIELPVVELPKK